MRVTTPEPVPMGYSVSAPVPMECERVRVVYEERAAYEGDYAVTPTDAEQVLRTNGLRMTGDIIIAPIPQTYGRVAWNGAFLTIS